LLALTNTATRSRCRECQCFRNRYGNKNIRLCQNAKIHDRSGVSCSNPDGSSTRQRNVPPIPDTKILNTHPIMEGNRTR
jgi:hypothetical protein